MKDLEALLRENPEDLVAWRVYADWLQEQGDPRGKLVLLEQRRQDTSLSIDDRHEAGQEAQWLAADHRRDWLAGWSPRVEARLTWRYGFVTAVSLAEADGLVGLASLLSLPTSRFLSEVQLPSLQPGQLPDLLEILARFPIRTLRLAGSGEGGLGEEGAIELARGLAPRELRHLALVGQNLHHGGLRALADAPGLRGLNELTIELDQPEIVGLSGLVHSETLLSLRTLRLCDCALDDPDLEPLLHEPTVHGHGLPALTALALPGNNLTDSCLRALLRSPRLPRLSALDLSRNLLGEGAIALGSLVHLSALDLSGNSMDEPTTEALTQTPLYEAGILRLWAPYANYDPPEDGGYPVYFGPEEVEF